MYQDPQINENINAPNNVNYVPQEPAFDVYSNVLQQPSSNIYLNAACSYSSDLSVNDNVFHDVNTPTFHPTYPSNEMQYNYNSNNTEQASIQYSPQSVMNMPPPLPADNLPQIQTNDSEIFQFVVPGYYIIMLPMSSPLVNSNNLDLQYQLQQNQLNQEQSYVSNVSDGSSINTQPTLIAQQQHDQQLESFNNLNFRN